MSATRLTETQSMVLSAASQRDDHCAMLPPSLKKLIDLGLVEAVRARGDLPVWRRERPCRCCAAHRGLGPDEAPQARFSGFNLGSLRRRDSESRDHRQAGGHQRGDAVP
jgi:hypothetical protein